MKKLEGKVAFITGGSRGMGAAISVYLAAEGADIVFTHSGKNQKRADKVLEAIKSSGNKGFGIVADSKEPEELINALKMATEELGIIDILVNNAGIYMHKSIEDYSIGDFDQMMSTNVKAVFVASQFAAKTMKSGGRIITIGSNMAERLAGPGGSLYSMSKSALIGLTKGIARDLGSLGITANLIQPGPVDTDMNPENSEIAPVLKKFMALGRYGRPEEVAGLVAFLSGPESQFITGASITIDGGFNI